MDSTEWVRQQEQRTAELLDRAEIAKSQLAQSVTTATSRDQSVTLRVGSSGMLLDLRFSPRANALTLTQLSVQVLETYRAACAEASARTVEVMSQLVGQDSPALDYFRSTIPSNDREAPGGGSA